MMTGKKGTRFLLVLPAFVLAVAPSACMEEQLESAWLPAPVAIDGSAREWAGREAYYDTEEGLKIGFFNDAQFLYVYFASWHRQTQAQILANGFTAWFDVAGGKKRTFGINYPRARPAPGGQFTEGDHAGMPTGEPGGEMPGGGDMAGGDPRGGRPGGMNADPAMMERLLSEASGELAIIDAVHDTLFMPAAEGGGAPAIAAMMGIANRTLVIEVRIPLDESGAIPYSLAAGPGDLIGVGFEIGEMKRPEWKPARERPSMDAGGIPVGGTGSGGTGAPPGGAGMGPPGRGGEFPEKFEMWAKVRLALRSASEADSSAGR